MTSKVKWARKPVMNQWAATVAGRAAPARSDETLPARENYQQYMFNPEKYAAATVARLRSLCEAQDTRSTGTRLRDGTHEEWKIIQGLAKGHIVSRS
uniref:Uncharacterized protein n=1 Tax=Peronospora matthiolae TaxID=2874970 RepID=A0AAV1VDY2_9STRA